MQPSVGDKSKPSDAFRVAVVEALSEDGGVSLRPTRSGHRSERLAARVATAARYQAEVGDRVLFASADGEHYVVGVIHSQRCQQVQSPDGTTAMLADGAIELRNAEGQLLFRYKEGEALVCAPRGDLRLAAPEGSVTLESALDVVVSAGRDLRHEAQRQLSLGMHGANPQVLVGPERTRVETEKLEVTAGRFRGAATRAESVVEEAYVTAQRLVQNVAHYELTAERAVERAKTKFRDVSDLFHSRVGRARQIVDQVFSLKSKRTVIKSEKDTSIDGRKILLG